MPKYQWPKDNRVWDKFDLDDESTWPTEDTIYWVTVVVDEQQYLGLETFEAGSWKEPLNNHDGKPPWDKFPKCTPKQITGFMEAWKPVEEITSTGINRAYMHPQHFPDGQTTLTGWWAPRA